MGVAGRSLFWFTESFKACVSENMISLVDHICLHPLQRFDPGLGLKDIFPTFKSFFILIRCGVRTQIYLVILPSCIKVTLSAVYLNTDKTYIYMSYWC